ncbi:hypothetical protein PR202_ga14151 [Eleusine coracana subsp. coracana]|uniref:CRIB domain-containing protein n=1 Tax=Eleusine coracana subsp. coracana TaxID=191504 RepID=A0AAV5CGK4_ELECO|nr:hypothetical protein QOZ80_3AG0208440 [Eleusine coracana subsp. coracana]GJM97240.1 hypothetical protein PR202_ga14151 [Eleusine coracana subsp. coracana]
MKDRRGSSGDRFAVFPFSIGCMSQSSVAVADPNEKKLQSDPSSSAAAATTTTTTAQSLDEGGGEATKEKGIVTAGVQRLMKGIKSLSLMFAVYEDDDEEEEQEMVIGYPTDVQHVGHIGWDGHGGLNKVGAMGMVNAFSLPSSLSFRQLEVAMDQAAHA